VLNRWGWYLRRKPMGQSWRWLFARLHSQRDARFCVVGGSPPPMAPPALGFAFSWHTHEPWSPLSTPPGGGRNMAGLVRDAEGALLILGGSDEHGVPLSTVSRWQPHDSPSSPSNTGTWSIGPDMRVERCCCGAAVDGTGAVWAVGGGEDMYRHSRAWDSVEVLEWPEAGVAAGDVGRLRWRDGPSLLGPRCAPGVAACVATARLFACGGYSGRATQEYLETAEALPPELPAPLLPGHKLLPATTAARWPRRRCCSSTVAVETCVGCLFRR
jgi:hypothetical protein